MLPSRSKPTRNDRRRSRLRRVPLARVLERLGYDVDPSADSVEQQFRCNLHGDGQDGKPSARCYPGSATWYCFACAQARDAVETLRERRGLPLEAALDQLEQMFGLPPLPWDAPEAEEPEPEEVRQASEGPVEALARCARRLGRDRAAPLPVLLQVWEFLDRAEVDPMFAADLEGKADALRGALLRAAGRAG